MTKLKSSHEFTEIPSVRHPRKWVSDTPKFELQRLALIAHATGVAGFGTRADSARRWVDRFQTNIRMEEDVAFCFDTRPGAFIERESEAVRSTLRQLTSEDASDFGDVEVHDWKRHPTSGKTSNEFGVAVDTPSIWTFR